MRKSLDKHPLMNYRLLWKNPVQVHRASITRKLELNTDSYLYHVQFQYFLQVSLGPFSLLRSAVQYFQSLMALNDITLILVNMLPSPPVFLDTVKAVCILYQES